MWTAEDLASWSERKDKAVWKKRLISATAIVLGAWLLLSGTAQGTSGQPLTLGQINTASSTTVLDVAAENGFSVNMTSGDGVGISASTSGDGQAIRGGVSGGEGGCAICGISDANNTAILAVGPAGFDGPIFVRQAGVVVVSAGQTKVTTKANQTLPDAALVLATVQNYRGTSVASASAHAATSRIIIHLTRATGNDVRVAWFVFAAG
jgi:hypothetical protein